MATIRIGHSGIVLVKYKFTDPGGIEMLAGRAGAEHCTSIHGRRKGRRVFWLSCPEITPKHLETEYASHFRRELINTDIYV